MVKTIKNITNMFCDVIFSYLRCISEAKQSTEVKNMQVCKKITYLIKILSIKQFFKKPTLTTLGMIRIIPKDVLLKIHNNI